MLGLGQTFVDSEVVHTISSPLAQFSRLRHYTDHDMTTSGAPFVIVLYGMAHEEIGARLGHVVLQA